MSKPYEAKFYLICYKATAEVGGSVFDGNLLLDINPLQWLHERKKDTNQRYPVKYALVSFQEITAGEYIAFANGINES